MILTLQFTRDRLQQFVVSPLIDVLDTFGANRNVSSRELEVTNIFTIKNRSQFPKSIQQLMSRPFICNFSRNEKLLETKH